MSENILSSGPGSGSTVLPSAARGDVSPQSDSRSGHAGLLTAAPTDWVVGNNAAIRKIARHVERAAEVQCTVLISGETGTGKELWAKQLHLQSPRAGKPFVP